LRPSARLYAAESEVLTVNTTKYRRRFDHDFFLTAIDLPLLLILCIDCFFLVFQEKGIEIEEKEPPLFDFKKKGMGL
jgi:hypothetical protein